MQSGFALFPSRRRMLAYGAMALGGSATAGHGLFLERHWTEVTTTHLTPDLGPGGPKRLRLAVLTDFHYDPLCEGEFMEKVVAQTNAAKPDLILLLGDFVSDHPEPAAELLSILAKLKAPLGVRAVLGNHDCWRGPRQIAKELHRNGIELLRNGLTRIRTADGQLTVAGLDSAWGGRPDQLFLATLKTDERALMAHHEPDYIDQLQPQWRDKIGLQVSGHTHGGQICAPGGVVLRKVSCGINYTRGLYRISPKTELYVSRGIGTVSIHARLFCRPEIAILELTNSARLTA